MPGLFAGTSLERPVTCAVCEQPLELCRCPRDGDGNILPAGEQTALVKLEKRRKGKVMTIVSGLDEHASDLPAILKQVKSACGAGGTIEQTNLEVQGDQREKIASILRGMGYKIQVN